MARITPRDSARILDAAERCFIEHGFHAASMADITTTAGMSAGLLYRYFNGKNQIVQAIIERHLETDGCQAMGAIHTCADFTREALERYERWRRRDDPGMNAALMLELSAEAARSGDPARHAPRGSGDCQVSDRCRAARCAGRRHRAQ